MSRVKFTPTMKVSITDSNGKPVPPSLFGDVRVVAPYTLADLANYYDIHPDIYGTDTSNGGTVEHQTVTGSIRLAITTTASSTARLRTHTYYHYQVGKTSRCRMTVFHPDAGQVGQTRRWGMFDDNNGLFFQLAGTTLSIAERSDVSGAPVTILIPQNEWNVDRFDGNGPSGLVLDITKINIYEIAYQWLGGGDVAHYIDGFLAHVSYHANVTAGPYMRTGDHPLSWEIERTAPGVAGHFDLVCSTVISDGGTDQHGPIYTAANSTDASVSTSLSHILSIRPMATFKSVVNRISMKPVQMSLSNGSGRIRWQLIRNATLTAPVWNSVYASSAAEFSVVDGAVSGGQLIHQGYMSSTTSDFTSDIEHFFDDVMKSRILRQSAYATSLDTLTVAAVADTGTSNARAVLTWEEPRS